jgi:hypothetical protein
MKLHVLKVKNYVLSSSINWLTIYCNMKFT